MDLLCPRHEVKVPGAASGPVRGEIGGQGRTPVLVERFECPHRGTIGRPKQLGLPMARQRKLTVTQLVSPAVHLDFHQISSRAKPLLDDAVQFAAFLRSYVSRWAGRSGVV